ncbi:hypothetical protein [Variovorax sp. PMC12]|uniref:hypothetical protein n=1 Tax=Variovorax sp. PMC12 TaxID=2126319 RepID=UPI000D13CA78|nr:hypothetical protein [Variovorax sp. PMC12]AVQ81687.1 hypothetical protein C4F17_12410 [Variovorax sp. PMC12]
MARHIGSGLYVDQVRKRGPVERVDGALRDADGLTVEDFDLPLNLMLACSVKAAQSAEHALAVVAAILTSRS